MLKKFTAEAKAKWDAIPQPAKERILKNVWCSHCGKPTTISDCRGQMKGDDLVLQGRCVRCGNAVVRVVEGE